MNVPSSLTVARDFRLESIAAELTDAAYPIALHHGAHQHWLKLQLELWHALALTVEKWNRQPAPERQTAHWEDYLAELTDAAYHTILCFGVRGPFLEVELGLHQALRTTLASQAGACQGYEAATVGIQ